MILSDTSGFQGMSAPEAGIRSRRLRTLAVRDVDDFVVNGQKIWTLLGGIGAHCASCMLLDTDPDAPTHKGIFSCLIVDMALAGQVEFLPLVTLNGDADFRRGVLPTTYGCSADALLWAR